LALAEYHRNQYGSEMTDEAAFPPITSADLLNEVSGGDALLAWFEGRVPSFHDAEILSLSLDHEGASGDIRIRTFQLTPDVDAQGFFVLTKHVVVRFKLSGIASLELSEFNHQNVIDGLILSRTALGLFRLELEPCYGLSGFVEAKAVAIEISPITP